MTALHRIEFAVIVLFVALACIAVWQVGKPESKIMNRTMAVLIVIIAGLAFFGALPIRW